MIKESSTGEMIFKCQPNIGNKKTLIKSFKIFRKCVFVCSLSGCPRRDKVSAQSEYLSYTVNSGMQQQCLFCYSGVINGILK